MTDLAQLIVDVDKDAAAFDGRLASPVFETWVCSQDRFSNWCVVVRVIIPALLQSVIIFRMKPDRDGFVRGCAEMLKGLIDHPFDGNLAALAGIVQNVTRYEAGKFHRQFAHLVDRLPPPVFQFRKFLEDGRDSFRQVVHRFDICSSVCLWFVAHDCGRAVRRLPVVGGTRAVLVQWLAKPNLSRRSGEMYSSRNHKLFRAS